MNHAQLRQRSSFDYSFPKRSFGNQVIGAISDALSRSFRGERTRTIIVGVNPTTHLLANELQNLGYRVSLVSLESESESEHETPAEGELVLMRAGAQSARCLLAASVDDHLNLRLCRIASEKFGVPFVISRLQMLDGITSWTRVNDAGMSRMSWNGLIQALVPDMLLSPALSRLARSDDGEEITEIEIRLPTFAGRAVEELPLEDCEVLAFNRDGAPISTYDGTVAVELGDVLTLIGTKAVLRKVQASFASL
jgi:Trk K+ transport system NAD-binding subunit